MEILIENYLLKQTIADPTKFDLTKLVVRKKKDGTSYGAENDIGFGLNIDTAIQKIIALNLLEKDATVTLREFIDEYKKERDKVLELTNTIFN